MQANVPCDDCVHRNVCKYKNKVQNFILENFKLGRDKRDADDLPIDFTYHCQFFKSSQETFLRS